jgi:hypothetical protein
MEYGIEVKLIVDEAIVHETLERIGILKAKEKILYPSCYLYTTKDDNGVTRFYIVHFKELFQIHGKKSDISSLDFVRRKTISYFLQKWNLIKVINPDALNGILRKQIDIIPFHERKNYKIEHKFFRKDKRES